MKNLKIIFRTVFLVLMMSTLTQSIIAQVSGLGLAYQAVIRDNNGHAHNNESIQIEFRLHQTNIAGTVVYSENHNLTTNAFGMIAAVIGTGSPIQGQWHLMEWADGPYYLEVLKGGVTIGTQRLESVPYAKVATDMEIQHLQNVSSFPPQNNEVLKWNGNEWFPGPDAGGASYQSGSGISISGSTINNTAPDQTVSLMGTGATTVSGTYPNFTVSSTDAVNDADADPTNEMQTLTKSGSTLILSGGGSVSVNDADASPTNEIQAITKSGNTLSLTGSSTNVSLPWTESGSNIYRTNGRVGIGTNSPGNLLHIKGIGQNLSRIEYLGTGTTFDLLEMVAPPGFTGQFIEFQQANSTVARIEADGEAEFKQVQVFESLPSTSTPEKGMVYRNNVPLAYGAIASNGTPINGFGITSVVKGGSGIYTVTIDRPWNGFPILIATVNSSSLSNYVISASKLGSYNNKFIVNIQGGDKPFNFIVYGNPL